ncbi:hypothetical protein HI914_03473 [Erysiphe necator]|uniref:Protein prenyltransferase n=1 Tax=Uncinula necator TaxID=52586 RepID=A0A0B1P0D5_UNCNE|nr:hypothetical protein HI914_03473 [Erysiphe necator]KHJ32112.1 putative protein prenylyltransferase [Erysiphe necator]
MSRALDLNHEDILINADLKIAYKNITQALNSCPDKKLEIEILGKSHALPPDQILLQDGPFIAIPKLRLVQAFIVAHTILFKYLRDCPTNQEVNLRNAASVLLLMDSEHLTAANTRKRLLNLELERARTSAKNALYAELCWVDGYLTSHLHRHTKSPILWAHRKWVLDQGRKFIESYDVLQDLTAVVLRSAERHPRNYYAWSHMRWLQKYETSCQGKIENPKANFDGLSIISIVQDWCLQNPSDTSGFSFLLHCLISTSISQDQTLLIFTKFLRFAISYKLVHESIWVFLRTLAAYKLYGEEIFNFDKFSSTIDIAVENQLNVAREWCRRYQLKTQDIS